MASDRERILYEWLVVRWRRGDRSAAAELLELFQRPLLYYLRRLVRSEADAWDVSQETWLSLFHSLHTLRDPQRLPAFVYRVGRNAALLHLRKQNAATALLESAAESVPDDADAADESFAAEDAAALHRALETLSPPHREVLTLFFLRDLSIEDIAAVVGVPEGTIKSRLFHGRRLLREALSGDGTKHAARSTAARSTHDSR